MPLLHKLYSLIIVPTSVMILVFIVSACASSSLPAYAPEVYDGTKLDGAAPNFQLIDQHENTLALSDFQDKVVILTFLDSQCKDVCPLTAAYLRKAHQALGNAAQSVVFLGINVNLRANTITDLTAATQQWQLDKIPTWHFLGGSSDALEDTCKSYGVEALPSQEANGDMTHTPGIYLIDQKGQQRWYISTSFVTEGTAAPSLPLDVLLVTHIQELLGQA